jgi:hypothetical protein
VSHGEASVMGGCVDYRRHELFCAHEGKDTRWRAADGCSGYACRACMEMVATWPSDDKVRAIPVDGDGIPLSRDDWTQADHIAHLIRTTERGPR